MMDRKTNTRWGLIAVLAALALIRPLLSITGAYEASVGRPWGPVIVTALIAVAWVGAVVFTRAPNPLLTLAAAGASYGVLVVLLQQVIWSTLLGGAPEGSPHSAPVLVVSWAAIVVTNAIWGALLGLAALGIGRLVPNRRVRA